MKNCYENMKIFRVECPIPPGRESGKRPRAQGRRVEDRPIPPGSHNPVGLHSRLNQRAPAGPFSLMLRRPSVGLPLSPECRRRRVSRLSLLNNRTHRSSVIRRQPARFQAIPYQTPCPMNQAKNRSLRETWKEERCNRTTPKRAAFSFRSSR